MSKPVVVGKIQKVHGVHGALLIALNATHYWPKKKPDRLFLEIDAIYVPYAIIFHTRRSVSQVIVQLEDICSREEAVKICQMPVLIIPSKKYIASKSIEKKIINYKVWDVDQVFLGTIHDVVDYSGQKIMVIHNQMKEILIPFQNHFIVATDEKGQIITVQLPEKFLENFSVTLDSQIDKFI